MAKEHEARQLAERNLAEARCAILPANVVEELTMQVVQHAVAHGVIGCVHMVKGTCT